MTNDKLLKRLNHNINRIKDETVRQLLVDCKSEIESCLAGQVSFIDEGEYPAFKQGAPSTDNAQLVTQELCANIVTALKEANDKLDAIGDSQIPEGDKEAIGEMLGMVKMMESAGFTGILESWKSSKYKFPSCVDALRKAGSKTGTIVAFDVRLRDGTTVTLRNPECADPEQLVPTSVSVSATAQTKKSDEG